MSAWIIYLSVISPILTFNDAIYLLILLSRSVLMILLLSIQDIRVAMVAIATVLLATAASQRSISRDKRRIILVISWGNLTLNTGTLNTGTLNPGTLNTGKLNPETVAAWDSGFLLSEALSFVNFY